MSEEYDVCIIGSGASGAVMATELHRFGFNVAVIEKGDWQRTAFAAADLDDASFAEDELYFKHWMPFVSKQFLEPTIFSETADGEESTTSVGYTYDLIGGGTCLYAGAAWRFREQDFKKLSHFGPQPGASLVDWPIAYSELKPYYDRAERKLRISGKVDTDLTEPSRDRNTLLKPIEPDRYSRLLYDTAEDLGWHPSYMPLAIDSELCKRSGWCSGFPCAFGADSGKVHRKSAKSSVDVRLLAKTLKGIGKYETERLKIFPNAVALRIESDSNGLCTGVVCRGRDEGARDFFVRAKIVVLAASAVQTARLALASDSSLFPDGLGNHNGLLGKNLMFHIYDKQMGIFPHAFPFELNKLIAVNEFYNPSRPDGLFPNACSIMSGSKWMPIKYARNVSGWGRRYMEEVARDYARNQLLQAAVEDLPQESNAVSLHPTRVDRYGMPVAKVVHRYHDLDLEAMRFTLDKCAQLMAACGAEIPLVPKPKRNITGNYTYHLMGTCRMGNDEDTSVVDANCRFHSVRNLYVIDGSVFPTSSALNPTLTIQANAYRVAANILASARRGELSR